MEDWDKAVRAFSEALEINPLFYNARIGFYHTFRKIPLPEKAEKELEILMHQGIQFPDLYLDLAEVYLSEENWDSALSWVNEAIRKNSGFEKAYMLASAILEKMGEIGKALGILNDYKEKSGQCSNGLALRILELKKKTEGV